MCNLDFFECLDNMEKAHQAHEELDSLGMGHGCCKSRESNLKAGLSTFISSLLLVSYVC